MARTRSINIYDRTSAEFGVALEANWHFFSFFRALFISPSYWLAHQHETGGLARGTKLTKDFRLVLKTYGDFGPVWETAFWDWWANTAQYHFGSAIDPKPKLLGALQRSVPSTAAGRRQRFNEMTNYELFTRRVEGLPATVLLAIPLLGSKPDILEQVGEILQAEFERAGLSRVKSRFPIQRNKIREQTVAEALRVVQARAYFDGQGKHLSELFTRSDIKADLAGNAKTRQRVLTIYASRHIRRGYLLAENAALGKFPSFAPLPVDPNRPPTCDFPQLAKLFDLYNRRSGAALAKLPPIDRQFFAEFAGRNKTINFR